MSGDAKVIQMDGQDFFAVEPRTDCPHITDENVKRPLVFSLVKLDTPCKTCDNVGENWVCLKCAEVYCSRYVNSHMVSHNAETKCPIALSFSDLSFWCYECDDYIQSPKLRPILKHFQKLKFPEDSSSIEKKMDELAIKEEDVKEEDEEEDDDEEESKEQKETVNSADAQAESRKKLDEDEDRKAKVKETGLDYLDIDDLCEKIKSGRFKKITVMTGAGISVSVGIPDFRTPGTGLYSQLEKYKLPYPEAVFTLDFFDSNPEPFYMLAKELYQPDKFKPSPTHWFIRLLADKKLMNINMTQNIDGLENLAGVPDDKVVECHGHFRTAHCTGCQEEISFKTMVSHIKKGEPLYCKKESCGKPCKPDIVFFGESLPFKFMVAATKQIPETDLLIVMGTSLMVFPFAALVNAVDENCPRVLINREATGTLAAAFDADNKDNHRDIFLQGDCDKVIDTLVEKLGWREEFEALKKSEVKVPFPSL